MKVAIWQVCSRHISVSNHRIAPGPRPRASITSTTTRPWPQYVTPTTTQAASKVIARLTKHQNTHVEHDSDQMMETLKSTSRSHRSRDQATLSSSR